MREVGVEVLLNKSPDRVIDLCGQFENIGIDIVWLSDHYFNRNPYVISPLILRYLRSLKVGIGVSNPYVIHPAYLASMVFTLSEIGGDRFNLGLGAGDKTTLESIGIRRERAIRRLRETIEIIRGLAEREYLEYHGEIFQIRHAKMRFKPPAKPRIFVGAQARQTLKLAGELADGVLLNASHPEIVRNMLQHLDEGLRKRTEEERRTFRIFVHMCLSVSEDREKAIKAAKPVVAYIAAGLPDEYVRDDKMRELISRIRAALLEGGSSKAVPLVTEELVDMLSVSGTLRECMDRIEQLLKLRENIGVVFGSPLAPSQDEAIKLLRALVDFVKRVQ